MCFVLAIFGPLVPDTVTSFDERYDKHHRMTCLSRNLEIVLLLLTRNPDIDGVINGSNVSSIAVIHIPYKHYRQFVSCVHVSQVIGQTLSVKTNGINRPCERAFTPYLLFIMPCVISAVYCCRLKPSAGAQSHGVPR